MPLTKGITRHYGTHKHVTQCQPAAKRQPPSVMKQPSVTEIPHMYTLLLLNNDQLCGSIDIPFCPPGEGSEG